MGRERQKKKNRSSINKVKATPRGRTKTGRKKIDFMGNAIIAENWDRSLTLTQNYQRLGLSSRLNAPTGGIEKKSTKNASADTTGGYVDPLAIIPTAKPKTLKPTEARVERDPKTGKILRVINDNTKANPLNDPLNELSSPEPEEPISKPSKGIVADLEAQAHAEEELVARAKRPRQQSKREEEWVRSMVEAHGDDYGAMFRDKKLNVMQQSVGDIKRRVQKWAKRHAVD